MVNRSIACSLFLLVLLFFSASQTEKKKSTAKLNKRGKSKLQKKQKESIQQKRYFGVFCRPDTNKFLILREEHKLTNFRMFPQPLFVTIS